MKSIEFARKRAAFTLVELLVVIAIIGVLVGLLLPAIQSAREAARNHQCRNNLMQISLAIHSYDMLHNSLPSGTINDPRVPVLSAPFGFHHNWIIALLPFMEQKNVQRAIDPSLSVYAAEQREARQCFLPVLMCASDTVMGPVSSYAGVHHHLESPIFTTNQGVFYLNGRHKLDDIPDGLSMTLFVGEKVSDGADLGWISGTRATLRNTGSQINAMALLNKGGRSRSFSNYTPLPIDDEYDDDFEAGGMGYSTEMVYEGDESATMPPEDGTDGLNAGETDGRLYESNDAETMPEEPIETDNPNLLTQKQMAELAATFDPSASLEKLPPLPWSPLIVGGFASSHSADGANFIVGDGSVKFISSNIDFKTYQQLGNRDDGRPLSMNW